MKIPIIAFYLLISLLFNSQQVDAQKSSAALLPEPLAITQSTERLHIEKIVVDLPQELSPLYSVLERSISNIYGLKLKKCIKSNIVYTLDPSMDSLSYSISIDDKVQIKVGSYMASAFATSTLLQLMNKSKDGISVPKVSTIDQVKNDYQGLMVDVARKEHSIETLQQIVDICFFYKTRYLQIHLSDDQAFTFPTEKYPLLNSNSYHFTKAELSNLVEYAKDRGVIIVPEFDMPGHTSSMRRAMPELFGEENLYAINLASEDVWEAIYAISEEIMDVFYTSPYFHIGGDEAYLEPMGKLPEVQELIKERGYDDVHDLFLEFIVNMNDFIKSKGKTTIVWESFQGKGSKHVTIPDDMLVFAWETLYQKPQSLIDNGFKIINSSWKPLYVTPWMRWDQQAILDWNPALWQNHWKITPSYNGMQLDKSESIIGTNFCSWEMKDECEVIDIKYRLPALSAKSWVMWRDAPADFFKRFEILDEKMCKLLFPAELEIKGRTTPNYRGVEWNQANYFEQTMSIDIATQKGKTFHYTVDGSMPDASSTLWSEALTFDKTTHLKVKCFDKDGQEQGYLNQVYEYTPLTLSIEGDYDLPRDINIARHKYTINNTVKVVLSNKAPEGIVRYSLKGEVTSKSKVYTEAVIISSTSDFKASLFDEEDNMLGRTIEATFYKQDQEVTLTTNKKVTCSIEDGTYTASKAVDGIVERENFWSADGGGPHWIVVDLAEEKEIELVKIYTYWDGTRYYQYTVEISEDMENWTMVADFSENKATATASGIQHSFDKTKARYIKVNMLHNSANPGLHVSEIRAY